MGKRGKPSSMKAKGKSGGGIFGGISKAAGMAKGKPSGGGMTSGLYRVTPRGDIVKISQKRRKKGFRTPAIVKRMMEQAERQNERITNALMVASLSK